MATTDIEKQENASTIPEGGAEAVHCTPLVRIFDGGDGYTLYPDVPVVKGGDADVQYNDDTLMIDATVQPRQPQEQEYLVEEHGVGNFGRSSAINMPVNAASMRAELKKSIPTRQPTQDAIDSLPDAVVILGSDGRIATANHAAEQLFALRTGLHASALNASWLIELHRSICETHRPLEPRGYASALQILEENGEERFFLPHAVPMIDDDGQLLGVTLPKSNER